MSAFRLPEIINSNNWLEISMSNIYHEFISISDIWRYQIQIDLLNKHSNSYKIEFIWSFRRCISWQNIIKEVKQ